MTGNPKRGSAGVPKNSPQAGDVWDLEDFLTDKRRNMDRKYDYRYSQLVFVFSELIREGWLEESMLNGLNEEKIDLVRKFTRFSD